MPADVVEGIGVTIITGTQVGLHDVRALSSAATGLLIAAIERSALDARAHVGSNAGAGDAHVRVSVITAIVATRPIGSRCALHAHASLAGCCCANISIRVAAESAVYFRLVRRAHSTPAGCLLVALVWRWWASNGGTEINTLAYSPCVADVVVGAFNLVVTRGTWWEKFVDALPAETDARSTAACRRRAGDICAEVDASTDAVLAAVKVSLVVAVIAGSALVAWSVGAHSSGTGASLQALGGRASDVGAEINASADSSCVTCI